MAKLVEGQKVTLRYTKDLPEKKYHFGGECYGGCTGEVKRIDKFIDSENCYRVSIQIHNGPCYNMVESELVEYSEETFDEEIAEITGITLLPEKFYVKASEELVGKINDVFGSDISYNKGSFIGTDDKEEYGIYDINEETAIDSNCVLLSEEHVLKAIKETEEFFLLNKFYCESNREVYNLLLKLFPQFFVSGETWDSYGNSSEYSYLGSKNTGISFQRKDHFQGAHCHLYSTDRVIAILKKVEKENERVIVKGILEMGDILSKTETIIPLNKTADSVKNKKQITKFFNF
jgi:hypothetical protein